MKTLLTLSLCAFAGLVACDSGSSTAPVSPGPASSSLPGVSTVQVGAESFRPIMGGYRELKAPIRRGAIADSIDETTVNFIVLSSSNGTGLSGGILIENVGLGTYSVDTSYFAHSKPRMAELSFHRYRPGIDSCYFSAMSGTLEVTALRDTLLSTGPGHLISGTLTAKMGLPWAERSASCSKPLDAAISFSSILLKRYD